MVTRPLLMASCTPFLRSAHACAVRATPLYCNMARPSQATMQPLSLTARCLATSRRVFDKSAPTSTSAAEPKVPEPKKFSIKPFMELARVDRPIGSWLLFLPCTWSMTLASHFTGAPVSVWLTNLALFGAGSWIMRGAGCTINDMWDAKIDAKVGTYKLPS